MIKSSGNMSRICLCLILVVLFTGELFSQDTGKDQEKFLDAEYFLMLEDFSDALPYYTQLYANYPDNAYLAYRIGICYLNIQGQKHKALDALEIATKKISNNYVEGSLNQTTAPNTAWYFLAMAYRINYEFEKAGKAFLNYRETLNEDEIDNIKFINHEISVCNNAKSFIANPVKYSEINIGDQFNDSNSNFNPVFSFDTSKFAFMSSLKFYDAVFFSFKVKDKWSSPINITPEIQSDGDLYISCLAADGNMLCLSKDDNNDSDLYFSEYDGISWSAAKPFGKNINTKYWESHAFIIEDGSAMIFSSDRPGGYGGLDLYISIRQTDGKWGEPENMGPGINTAYNEDRAFMIDEGKQLFFCSQGHYNMGGFDLFKSKKLSDGNWSKPENLGYPINTPDDDIFFMPLNDGSGGYISGLRKGAGYGREDIYLVTFK